MSFTEVLSLLRTKGLVQYAETLEYMGVVSLEDLAERSPEELCAAGVREDHTLVLTEEANRVTQTETETMRNSRRNDHPLIDPKTRGSKRLAMKELGTKEDKEKWRRILLNDMYARTSRAPRET